MPATDSAHYTSVAVVHGNEIHIVGIRSRRNLARARRCSEQPAQVDTVPTTVPALTPEPAAALISFVRHNQSAG
jgi:hypothetical protein